MLPRSAFAPTGQTASLPHTESAPLPAGQGSVILPRPFLRRKPKRPARTRTPGLAGHLPYPGMRRLPLRGKRRIPKSPNPQIPKSPNPQIPKSPNPQIPKSPNPQIPKSPNPQIPKSPNPQIPKSPNPQIPKSPNPQIPKSPNPQIPKSPNAPEHQGTDANAEKRDVRAQTQSAPPSPSAAAPARTKTACEGEAYTHPARNFTPPKHLRRQAPARGPAAVYSLLRPKRNENTERPPPARGAGVRRPSAVAPAAGTAGTRQLRPPALPARRRQAPARGLAAAYSHLRPKRNENTERPPPARGAGVRHSSAAAPAAGTAGFSTCRRPCRQRRGWQPVPARGCP